MLDHATEAVDLTRDKRREDLDLERLLQLGLVRLVEIIGEASAKVSEETRSRHSSIAWREIVGTRNRLIHGNDFVDHDILWQTVQ